MYQVILEKVGAVSAALARCGPKGPGPVGRPLGRVWTEAVVEEEMVKINK